MRSCLPAERNFSAQGKKAGAWRARTKTGPFGSISHLGIFRHRPGTDCGTQLQGEMTPALPKLVSSQGGFRSINVTESPRSASCKAQQTPTMPAPTTTTFCFLHALSYCICIHNCHPIKIPSCAANSLSK